MKTRQLLLIFVSLMLAVTAGAQTDVTKYFLKNYDFDSNFNYDASSSAIVAQEILEIPEWTPGFTVNYTITGIYEFGFKGKFNSGSVPSSGIDGESGGALALSTGWSQEFYYTQSVTLPAGTYTLEVPTYNGFTATGGTSMVAWVPQSGTAVTSKLSSYPSQQWVNDKITFTLTAATTGNIRIGYKAADNGSGSSANLLIDYVRLTATAMDVKPLLLTVINSAKGYYGTGTGIDAAKLDAAITSAQQVYDNATATDLDVLEERISLESAITAYRMANISEENPLDVTSYISNPSFEKSGTNGWTVSDMKTQTNSEFRQKKGATYVEKWVEKGNPVGDARISQTITLPLGKYILTVGAQNMNQNNVAQQCEGACIFAGDASTTVYTPADYSVRFTNVTGKVEIGFVAEGAKGNWICVDNFRLYQVGVVDDSDMKAALATDITVAESLTGKMMNTTVGNRLDAAVQAAKEITSGTVPYNTDAAEELKGAIAAARESIGLYTALNDKITSVSAQYDETKNGAADFKAAIDRAKAIAADASVAQKELEAAPAALDDALFAYLIANPTEGGTVPEVTSVNPYVVTGATEALLRATFSAGAYKERGVCWSTQHNPLVTDSRTTKNFTLNGTIFHLKGLKSATVYYLRPYVIGTNYEVSYGDEVKIVTHPAGTCTWSWDEAGPDDATNDRCRLAVKTTIDYFNEWTGVKGFHLSGHYSPGAGAGDGTADCSYGGWMRISQNTAYQAIGTVLHETGHGVGVGTESRYWDTNVHSWEWFGREANKIYHFLENKYDDPENVLVGDGVHAWGSKATYDWFVNGANKDTHQELQYIGGSAMLYGLFIDGLNPTEQCYNGLSGYTFNFDDSKKYYIMCKDEAFGGGTSLLYMRSKLSSVSWEPMLAADTKWYGDSCAWKIEYDASKCRYAFRNVKSGMYLNHNTGALYVTLTTVSSPSDGQFFQLMPDRKDATFTTSNGSKTACGYWFTWVENKVNRAMEGSALVANKTYGNISNAEFNFAETPKQQFIIISEDELDEWRALNATGVMVTEQDGSALHADGKFIEGDRLVIYSNGVKYDVMGR